MAEEFKNEPQEKSEMLFSLGEPMHKMPYRSPPHKCEKRELKIKSDLKPYFEDDQLENLRENSFRQGEDDAPTKGHDEEHPNDLPKSKYVQEVLQAKRKHQDGQGLPFPDLHNKGSKFLTLVWFYAFLF